MFLVDGANDSVQMINRKANFYLISGIFYISLEPGQFDRYKNALKLEYL